MIQEILVGLLFIAAVIYLVRPLFRKPKTHGNCDKCAPGKN